MYDELPDIPYFFITIEDICTVMDDIGSHVQLIRQMKGLSLKKVAIEIGIGCATLYRVECNGGCTLRTGIKILRWIAKSYEAS